MNDANHVTAETDELTPRVHFLINPNDGSLCLIRGLVSPGRSMARHIQSDIELQMRAYHSGWLAMIDLLKGYLLDILRARRNYAEVVLAGSTPATDLVHWMEITNKTSMDLLNSLWR